MKRRILGGFLLVAACVCLFISNKHRETANIYESNAQFERSRTELYLTLAAPYRTQANRFLYTSLGLAVFGGTLVFRRSKSTTDVEVTRPDHTVAGNSV